LIIYKKFISSTTTTYTTPPCSAPPQLHLAHNIAAKALRPQKPKKLLRPKGYSGTLISKNEIYTIAFAADMKKRYC
jgi:hypothetical protein